MVQDMGIATFTCDFFSSLNKNYKSKTPTAKVDQVLIYLSLEFSNLG